MNVYVCWFNMCTCISVNINWLCSLFQDITVLLRPSLLSSIHVPKAPSTMWRVRRPRLRVSSVCRATTARARACLSPRGSAPRDGSAHWGPGRPRPPPTVTPRAQTASVQRRTWAGCVRRAVIVQRDPMPPYHVTQDRTAARINSRRYRATARLGFTVTAARWCLILWVTSRATCVPRVTTVLRRVRRRRRARQANLPTDSGITTPVTVCRAPRVNTAPATVETCLTTTVTWAGSARREWRCRNRQATDVWPDTSVRKAARRRRPVCPDGTSPIRKKAAVWSVPAVVTVIRTRLSPRSRAEGRRPRMESSRQRFVPWDSTAPTVRRRSDSSRVPWEPTATRQECRANQNAGYVPRDSTARLRTSRCPRVSVRPATTACWAPPLPRPPSTPRAGPALRAPTAVSAGPGQRPVLKARTETATSCPR